MTFAILHYDRNPAFQPIAVLDACALRLRDSFVYFACVTKVRVAALYPKGMKRKTLHAKAVSNGLFLSKIPRDIIQHIFKMK